MSKNKQKPVPTFRKTEIASLPVGDCLALLKKNPEILLLDVRRFDEHAEAAIPGSRHLELPDILDGKWADLVPYKQKGVLLYCRSGVRSLKAAQYLLGLGFEKLWNMEGGILAYQAQSEDS